MAYSSETTIREEVDKVEPDRYKPAVVYRFNDGREFEDSDASDSGIYDGT